jgi:sulfur carrier protein
MMKVYINGLEVVLREAMNIQEFLQQQNMEITRGYALAVNDMVVPKSAYETYILQPSDKVLIIKATAGG